MHNEWGLPCGQYKYCAIYIPHRLRKTSTAFRPLFPYSLHDPISIKHFFTNLQYRCRDDYDIEVELFCDLKALQKNYSPKY